MNTPKINQEEDAVVRAIIKISHGLQLIIVGCAGYVCGLYFMARALWRGEFKIEKKAQVKKGDV